MRGESLQVERGAVDDRWRWKSGLELAAAVAFGAPALVGEGLSWRQMRLRAWAPRRSIWAGGPSLVRAPPG